MLLRLLLILVMLFGFAGNFGKAHADASLAAEKISAGIGAALERPLSPDETNTITADVIEAWSWNSQNIADAAPVVYSMGVLAREGSNAALRAVMDDLQRQLLANVLTHGNATPTVRLLDSHDKMLSEMQLGMGISREDVRAYLMMERLAVALPEDPASIVVTDAEVDAASPMVVDRFLAETLYNQHWLSRLDQWVAGTIENWPYLSREERWALTAIIETDQNPTPDLLQRVFGGADLSRVMAVLQFYISTEQMNGHPELIEFLRNGGAVGGMGRWVDVGGTRTGAGGGDLLAAMQSVQMLQNLNGWYMNHGVFSDVTPGAAMMGLQ